MHTQIDAVTADSRIQMQEQDAAEQKYNRLLKCAQSFTEFRKPQLIESEYPVIETLDAEHVLRVILMSDKPQSVIDDIWEHLRHVAIEQEMHPVEYVDMPELPDSLS